MRTIKFRGVRRSDGKTIYGDFNRHKGVPYIDEWSVHLESVAQFCGLDENDDEIYEGDTVVAHGKEYVVELVPKYGLFSNLKNCRKK